LFEAGRDHDYHPVGDDIHHDDHYHDDRAAVS
jgi:hypothetical protein